MIGQLKNWYQALSRREQLLVGAAVLLTALVVAVYLALALSRSIDDKQRAYIDAQERRARIEIRAQALSKAARVPIIANQGSLELAISQSAAEKGFTLDKTEARGNDRVAIIISQARPIALLGWISELEGQAIDASEVAIKPGANGTVSANITFARQGR